MQHSWLDKETIKKPTFNAKIMKGFVLYLFQKCI